MQIPEVRSQDFRLQEPFMACFHWIETVISLILNMFRILDMYHCALKFERASKVKILQATVPGPARAA